MIVDHILQAASQLSVTTLIGSVLALFVLTHAVPYLYDANGLRPYPGPFLAKFSNLWLTLVAKDGHRSEVIHKLHQQYGPFVRISPDELSISDPDALQIVYGHGNGALKAPFYDAFVSIQRGLFNSRDRNEHSRKRKIVSHIFSQKSVLEFEPHVRLHVQEFLDEWNRLYDLAAKGGSGEEGEGWHGKDGALYLDVLPWANYLAFDIIGDLAFGGPFGMIKAGKDFATVPVDQAAVMASYGSTDHAKFETREIPAVQILNGRGEFSMTLGCVPARWRLWARKLPAFQQGGKDVKNLAGIAVMAVAKRLATPTDRVDLLTKLQAGKDDQGNPMGRSELTAEALTLLIAGSDTTSNSTCAIIYYLAQNPAAQSKLQSVLDEILDGDSAATIDQVKDVPYLDACINEGLRLHSTSSLGLPRLVPEDGMEVCGQKLVPGSVVSVPSFSIHRDSGVWGEDVEAYRPERWFERDQDRIQRTFNPYSYGPRACVGRNLATLELQIIVSSILRRFEFVLEDPNFVLETREGFLRKPLGCRVGVKRRL